MARRDDIARLIHMVGKLSERPGGGTGLYVAPSQAAKMLRMTDLADELHKHDVPFKLLRSECVLIIEPLMVRIKFVHVQDMMHRIEGYELNALVDDATCAVKLSEQQWYAMNIVRSRVRE